MPKREDLNSILIIGAGPIVIGQACEFDYSGVQACKSLREEGYRVILVNSNPATIMTDPDMADATYIEPITPEMVEKIIANERPDALLPTMGGQTGLNTGIALAKEGAPERGAELQLRQVMTKGSRVEPPHPLERLRERFAEEFSRLPDRYKALRSPALYTVSTSEKRERLRREVSRQVSERERAAMR